MTPAVYLFRKRDQAYELYIGHCTTLQGLRAIPKYREVQIVHMGASSYKKYGWATEKEFPKWNTVQEVLSFLEEEGDFGLINFEIEIDGFGHLFTHDDAECYFRCKEKKELIAVVKSVADVKYGDVLVAALLSHAGLYIELGAFGELKKYRDFEHYIAAKEGADS